MNFKFFSLCFIAFSTLCFYSFVLIPFLLSKWSFEGGKRGKRRAKIKTKTRESKAKLLPRPPKGARTGSKKANFTLLAKASKKQQRLKVRIEIF
jgi:hypothetical protein